MGPNVSRFGHSLFHLGTLLAGAVDRNHSLACLGSMCLWDNCVSARGVDHGVERILLPPQGRRGTNGGTALDYRTGPRLAQQTRRRLRRPRQRLRRQHQQRHRSHRLTPRKLPKLCPQRARARRRLVIPAKVHKVHAPTRARQRTFLRHAQDRGMRSAARCASQSIVASGSSSSRCSSVSRMGSAARVRRAGGRLVSGGKCCIDRSFEGSEPVIALGRL